MTRSPLVLLFRIQSLTLLRTCVPCGMVDSFSTWLSRKDIGAMNCSAPELSPSESIAQSIQFLISEDAVPRERPKVEQLYLEDFQ